MNPFSRLLPSRFVNVGNGGVMRMDICYLIASLNLFQALEIAILLMDF
jgi:hypothetical protein